MRNHRKERLSDSVALRTTASQRTWLEGFSRAHNVPMGEGIRLLIDDAMARAGAI